MKNTLVNATRFCLLASTLLFGACALPVQQTSGQLVPGTTLLPTPKVVILDIPDGQERGQDATKGSGQATTATIASATVYRAVRRIPVREVEVAHDFVVLAARAIPVGTRLGAEDVKRVGWPASSPLPGAFTRTEDVVGRGLVTALSENMLGDGPSALRYSCGISA